MAKNKDDYQIVVGSKLFDGKWYLKQNLDVKKHGVDPALHYLNNGWHEGREPSTKFSGNLYLSIYKDVKAANINPLVHYEKFGKKEGRINPVRLSSFHKLKQQLYKIVNFTRLLKNKNARILVVLHLFYIEEWDIISRYLGNLDCYSYKLIVTLVENHYNDDIISKIKNFKSDADIKVYKNFGFDVGTFVDVISHIDLNQYDIVFKLQSKGLARPYIYIYNQIFKYADLFYNLYDGILGERSVHKAVDVLMSKNKIGMVASENLIIHDPKHKQFFTHQIANSLNINILENYQYVAGTCFAIKARLLQRIKQLGIPFNKFEETSRGKFSLAHAMERLICASIETEGYHFYGIKVKRNQYSDEVKEAQRLSSIPLLDDSRFNLDYDFFYRMVEHKRVEKYEIKKIKLKDIRRWWNGRLYRLTETSVYAYVSGHDAEKYENYCKMNAQVTGFEMSKKRFDDLIESLDKGFDEKNMPVLHVHNEKTLIIMDGQHRCCYLLKKYGPEYEVPCLLLYY